MSKVKASQHTRKAISAKPSDDAPVDSTPRGDLVPLGSFPAPQPGSPRKVRLLWIAEKARFVQDSYRGDADRYHAAESQWALLRRAGIPYGDDLSREQLRVAREACEAAHSELRALADAIPHDLPEVTERVPLVIRAGFWHIHAPDWSEAERQLNTVWAAALAQAARADAPPAGNGAAKPSADDGQTYAVADVLNMLRVSGDTLHRYANAANVATPARGKKNHRYSASDVRSICKAVLASNANATTKTHCRKALDAITSTADNPN